MIAELDVYYTLEQFRENEMPEDEDSLLFRLNNTTVDCDVGTLEVSKFRPVKIYVQSGASQVWAESDTSDHKLQLFCAHMLKRHVCSRPLIHGQLPDYAPRRSKNPFDNREIIGVQYLTQIEIDAQVDLYGQVEDDVQILNRRLETLEAEKSSLENEIEQLQAQGKSTRVKEAMLNMNEQNIRAARLSLEQSTAAQRSLITTLRYDHTVDEDDGKLLTPLFAAIGENDQDAVEEFLRNGAYPNEVDEDGYNALHWAAHKGCRITIFNLILEKIDNVNAVDEDGWTALMFAAYNNHLIMVTALMNHPGINLNVQSNYNSTALHLAVNQNHIAIVERLLRDDRVDTTLKNNDSDTPLDAARKLLKISSRDRSIRRSIIEKLERFNYERAMARYQVSNDDENPPLNAALKAGDYDAVDALLTGGQNPNKVDERRKNALHLVANVTNHDLMKRSLPSFNKILEKIENVNAVDNEGNTALMFAVARNHMYIVVSLMHHQWIDLNVQNRLNITALHVAVLFKHPGMVDELLSDYRIDTSLKGGRDNLTPLEQADRSLSHGNPIIEMLERFNYDLAMSTYSSDSLVPPLNAALKAHDEDAIDALLRGRADPNQVNQYGRNALHTAAAEGCSIRAFGRILNLILNKNAVAAGGTTALMLAAMYGRLEHVKMLFYFMTLHSGPVDLNLQDSRGFTALHHAVNTEAIEVVHELLLRLSSASQSQIDLTLKDSNGKTALDLAIDNGNSNIITMLRDAYRRLSAQDVGMDVDNTISEVFTLKF